MWGSQQGLIPKNLSRFLLRNLGLGSPATGSEEMLEGWQQGCQGPLHFGKFPLVVGGVQNIREAKTHRGSGPPSLPQAVAVIVT